MRRQSPALHPPSWNQVDPPAAPAAVTPSAAAPTAGVVQPSTQQSGMVTTTAEQPRKTARSGGREALFQIRSGILGRIRDRNDKVIFSKLNPAGSEEHINATPPLKLIVGNARGVRLNYDDQPVNSRASYGRDGGASDARMSCIPQYGAAPRRASTPVSIGHVRVGGEHPIVVQSMTNTDTADIEGTAQQVEALARAGSELVRITVNTREAAAAVRADPRAARRSMGVQRAADRRFPFQRPQAAARSIPECARSARQVPHQSRATSAAAASATRSSRR